MLLQHGLQTRLMLKKYLSNVLNRRSPKKWSRAESCWWVWRDKHIKQDESKKQAKRRDKNINHFSGSLLRICCIFLLLPLSVLLAFTSLGVNRETFLRILFFFVTDLSRELYLLRRKVFYGGKFDVKKKRN